MAALRGRELRRVHPQVLARYGGLGLASLPEHVLALGQPHDVLGTGAHSMVTGDLWDEKVRPRVMLGFATDGMQTELRVEIYTSELVGVFQEIHYISSL